MPLHQWDYIFAFGTIFAALDAYNIGANDVANSFATSVASRSLTLKQACIAAAFCEFLGAVLVGARVTRTVKGAIIPIATFQSNAGVELLAFTCALIASATWLMIATRYSWPVSTTYSIVSALAGVGVAVAGKDAVAWGWNNGEGLVTIFAGFIIAPGMAGIFASIIYMLTKFFVFMRKNPTRAGLFASPVYFFGVTAILTLSIVYKGAPSLKLSNLNKTTIVAAILGTSAVVTLLQLIFWLPFVYSKVVKNDYNVRWYHIFIGPALWWRPAPPDAETISQDAAVPDYQVAVHDFERAGPSSPPANRAFAPFSPVDAEKAETRTLDSESGYPLRDLQIQQLRSEPLPQEEEFYDPYAIEGSWLTPENLWIILRYKAIPWIKHALTYGLTVDVLHLQKGDTKREITRLNQIHHRARQYDNQTEHLYSFLQVMTACAASFAHGSNDVANAMGPYSAIYDVWSSGQVSGKESPVRVWILAFGGGMIVFGLATYGYNIMRVLGNRLTLHSPSRGFSMELGSAITVLLASQYGIPVSTTMCITGATVGVALCNGDVQAVNWRGLGWILAGWVLTVPIAGTAAGLLMGIMLNTPHF